MMLAKEANGRRTFLPRRSWKEMSTLWVSKSRRGLLIRRERRDPTEESSSDTDVLVGKLLEWGLYGE